MFKSYRWLNVFPVLLLVGFVFCGRETLGAASSGRPAPVKWEALTEKKADLQTLLVGFKAQPKGVDVKAVASKRGALHTKAGTQLKHAFKLVQVHSVKVPAGRSLKDVAAVYESDPDVAYVEPNYKVHPSAIPSDTLYSYLWGMTRIRAPEAWDMTTGNSNVVVAVLDTGVRREHLDLIGNMWQNEGELGPDGFGSDKSTNGIDDDANGYVDDWRGWDFFDNDNDPSDPEGHGTHVSGTIGAIGDNLYGVAGVNWAVKIVPLRFIGPEEGSTEDAIAALEYAMYAIPGVRLSNNSWGDTEYSQALKDAVDAAGAAGQLFIAAAGNDGVNNDVHAHYPASYDCPNIIAVASINPYGKMSWFSNFGSNTVDIAAPGEFILSTYNDGSFSSLDGTSMAAPHVAGAAALIWGFAPMLTWQEVRDAILEGASINTNLTGKLTTGGELDLVGALGRLNPPVLSDNLYYVLENSTTNIEMVFGRALSSTVVVSVARSSGSTNLYVVGTPALEFTPDNWSVPQSFSVGALYDDDATNDTALFVITAPGVGATRFTLQQMDLGDTIPPKCVITGQCNVERTEVTVTFHFDEAVSGFETNDIVYQSNIAGGATLVSLVDLGGSNQIYQATFTVGAPFGALTLRVPAGSVTDQGGNAMENPQYDFIYTLPWVKTDFTDDFEGGTTWVRSTNTYEGYTTDGWRWGVPSFGVEWDGPLAAYSGDKCWGVMDGPYTKRLDAWVDSPAFRVGANPVLRFQRWISTFGELGAAYVQVSDGAAWYNVTPGGYYFDVLSPGWEAQEIQLNNALFGNRVIRVRFRVIYKCAMYVDDVSVESQQPAGVYVISAAPTNGSAGGSADVSLTVYNSATSTLSGVAGHVTCGDIDVSVDSGSPVGYGTMVAGAVAASPVPVQVSLAAGPFAWPQVFLNHHARSGTLSVGDDCVPITVDGWGDGGGTNILSVFTSSGVTNGVGRYLEGDGSPTSCIFQVIYAGANGTIDPPEGDGGTTGDDRILYGPEFIAAWGRFGEGYDVPHDGGRFSRLVMHGLVSNSMIYVRAWDAPSFALAGAYGDSRLKAVSAVGGESIDMGSWGVATPVNFPASGLAALPDRDGDSIPDAWCVLFGVDPSRPVVRLETTASVDAMVTGLNRPGGVAVSSNLVFIADSDNNRIEVWDRALSNRLVRLGSLGTGTNQFNRPQGVSVNADGTRLMVADTLNYRIMLFSVDPLLGTLSYMTNFGSRGSAEGEYFNTPFKTAYGAGDSFCVADSHSSLAANHRVHRYASLGAPVVMMGSLQGLPGGYFDRPLGVDFGAAGQIYVADSSNHRLQMFQTNGWYAWKFGNYGTNLNQFQSPRDVKLGMGGHLYVAETGGNRIQILDTLPGPLPASLGAFGQSGSEPGQFRAPQGLAPARDDGALYVADTFNNRVQKLWVIVDGDGDGMDDVWENLNGLDNHDPADAFEDADGDGLLNIGEYRLGANPLNPDTNGNGGSDGWDVAHGLSPVALGAQAVTPPWVTITCDATNAVYAGTVVRVTATFSEPVTNVPAPVLTLLGGAFLWQAAMTEVTPSVWVYDYTVQAGDMGVVDAQVGGVVDLEGYGLDPDPTARNGLFDVYASTLEILGFGGFPQSLSWEAVLGGIYEIQSAPTLTSNTWSGVGSVTSTVDGLVIWTNLPPMTNTLEFFRVRWINVP